MIKLPNCCTMCDEPIWEPIKIVPADLPKAGRILRAGKLIDDDAVRVTFVMSDGTQCSMSLCGKCSTSYDMNLMWKKNLTAIAEEVDESGNDKHRETLGKMANEFPLGELYRQKWKDMADARVR